MVLPKTIDEAINGQCLIKQNFAHISWEDMHTFLEKYYDFMTEEQKLIVSLNRQWIIEKCKVDFKNNRQIWTIDLSRLEEKQLDLVLEVIKSFSQSEAVNKLRKYKTEESTIEAARKFLEKMLLNPDEWQLVGFYSRLFALIENTTYLKFNRKGIRGFSIKR